MKRTVRTFLLAEGFSFVLAGATHAGLLLAGYQHRQASIAESCIGAVLLAGFGLTWVLPARTRSIGLATQGFALLGTLVGAFTIAIGVGPRTAPDLAFHAGILAVLAAGLIVTGRQATQAPRSGSPAHHVP